MGYDPSAGPLAEARTGFTPALNCAGRRSQLLRALRTKASLNVLCETAIMHPASAEIPAAVKRLIAMLKPGGALYLTWRVSKDSTSRDKFGLLYASFDPALVLDALSR